MNNKDLGLEESIKSDGIQSITSELLEVGLDSVLDDGTLKEIPFFSIAYGLVKTGINIKDRLFLKKLIRLLYKTKEVPVEDRIKIIDKINDEDKYRFKVGEKLLFLVDKADELEKVDYISLLFSKLLLGKINFNQFLKASESINKTFIGDLKWFLDARNDSLSALDDSNHSLFNSGILQLQMNTVGFQFTSDFSTIDLGFELSETGHILRRHLTD